MRVLIRLTAPALVLAADLAVAAQGGENVSMSKVLRGGGELGGGRDTLKKRH
ncbi:hypothetical protein N9P99_00255 [Planktomarina temperata]|nr:hypothetical protein [Planktomarina temperata]